MPCKFAHLPRKLPAALHERALMSIRRHIGRNGFGDLGRIKQCEAIARHLRRD
jgi:hypothetical protein